MTKLIKCTCEHKDQDKRYGPQMRVHNEGTGLWRCTVCGNVVKDSGEKKK